jgi:hypothetical protein
MILNNEEDSFLIQNSGRHGKEYCGEMAAPVKAWMPL